MSRILHHAMDAFSESYGASGFSLRVYQGAQAWVPTAHLESLRTHFPNPAWNVHLRPRNDVGRVLGRPSAPYAFRAFTRGADSHIFVDETETPDSIAWLIAHELGHRLVKTKPRLNRVLTGHRPRHLDPQGDTFHVQDPEEALCNTIAHRVTGQRLDRAWWRSRIHQLG